MSIKNVSKKSYKNAWLFLLKVILYNHRNEIGKTKYRRNKGWNKEQLLKDLDALG